MRIVGSERIYDEGADGAVKMELPFPVVLRCGGVQLGWIEECNVSVGDCGNGITMTWAV